MSAAVAASSSYRLTFGGLLKSEWIKLWSLRSTYWCLGLMILQSFGLGLLLATVHGTGKIVEQPQVVQQANAAYIASAGTTIGELIVAVLGVLVISGEYGTGMIRSSVTADPRRLPTLAAKAVVLTVSTFVASLIAVYGAAAIAFPLLAGSKSYPEFGDGKLQLALLGAAAYLAIIALIAFSLGAIIRSTAGGIAAAVGVVLVLPIVTGVLVRVTAAAWAANIQAITPTSAGDHLFAYVTTGPPTPGAGEFVLDATTGPLVFVAWFVVLFALAAVLIKRRDA
jgi:ABC-2 type transport system permease protein